MRLLLILLILSFSGSQIAWSEEARNFMGWSTNAKTNNLEWWGNRYESRSECMDYMRWNVLKSVDYKEPYGCGYFGNSLFQVLKRFYLDDVLNGGGFECVWENLDPNSRKWNGKYGVGLDGKCDYYENHAEYKIKLRP